jgi:hypothetical protein
MDIASDTRRSSAGATEPRTAYLRVLAWSFALFSSIRVVAYVPTLWAIQTSGDASQHSLWTWITWTGANATMAAWLFEQNRQRMDRAMVVSLCNAAMCLCTTLLIVFYRW